jgi:gamma-glutamyltranspeptidase/glutathione hydrolase
MSRSLAIATDPIVEEAANDYLAASGSATGAVLCGFFAAAGAYGGVLMGPISILVAGTGRGARAFDGRLRQPGQGIKRPRGVKPEEAVPDQARIAVPASIPAAMVAYAYDGGQSLTSILRTGIQRATRAGAEERAGLLRQVRGSGAATFAETNFVRSMLRIAGPSQGGLLTPTDFSKVSDVDHDAVAMPHPEGNLFVTPWEADGEGADVDAFGSGAAVLAADVRGQLAALTYRRLVDGYPLDDLELDVPLAGSPVRRGERRVAPGACIAAPAAIGVLADDKGAWIEVLATPGANRLQAQSTARLALRRDPATKNVQRIR